MVYRAKGGRWLMPEPKDKNERFLVEYKEIIDIKIRISELEMKQQHDAEEIKEELSRHIDLISELEKKIKDLEDMQETIVETDPVRMDERIEKLESKIFHDYGGDLNQLEDAAIIQIELVKKVLKLEEWQDKSWNMHQEMAQEILPNQLEILEKQISELRDNVDSNRGQINANLDGINYCRKFMFSSEGFDAILDGEKDRNSKESGLGITQAPQKRRPLPNSKPSEPICPICDGTGINIYIERDKTGILNREVEYPCQCQKEPTEVAGSARQTEFELIEKFIPPRGTTCKDCMEMGKDELKMKEDADANK